MIRQAKVGDAHRLQKLINHYAQREEMLSLSLHEIYDSLRDFSVYEKQGGIVGVCALHISWQDLAEIRSLAVDEQCLGQGIGSQLLKHKLQEARELGVSRVFVLTHSPQFFLRHGFHVIDKAQLPHKIWADCVKCIKFPNCTETALMCEL
jgi:amino-acid N-acetyltransferase